MTILCPCCEGRGTIEEESPVLLTPMQLKIYNIVRKSKHGIIGPELVSKIYADRIDGGPDWASVSMCVQIKNMNMRLAVVREKIKADTRGKGGRYRLHRNVV